MIVAAGVVGLVPVAGLTFTARESIRASVTPAATIVASQVGEQRRPRQVIARRSDQYFVTRTVGSSRADSLLFVLINAKEPGVRRAAARSLRTDGADAPVVDVLVSALGDTCHADRWLATRALRELRAKRALPNLVKQLVEDSHVAVRSMAASAIATAGVSEGAALLRTAIGGVESTQVARVTQALETLGDTQAHAQLADAVRRASH
jgi:HEAT repeat protein